MKRNLSLLAVRVFCIAIAVGSANSASANKSLAATLNIYVFPTAGQSASKQSADEAECYNWAVQSSGTDPFEASKQAQQQAQQSAAQQQQAASAGRGSGAQGAVRGAAVGALIGGIADDDVGKGAAYGAVLGTIRGRRQGRAQQAQAQQRAQQQSQSAQAENAAKMDNFKRAFAVCLEAKKYLVK